MIPGGKDCSGLPVIKVYCALIFPLKLFLLAKLMDHVRTENKLSKLSPASREGARSIPEAVSVTSGDVLTQKEEVSKSIQ